MNDQDIVNWDFDLDEYLKDEEDEVTHPEQTESSDQQVYSTRGKYQSKTAGNTVAQNFLKWYVIVPIILLVLSVICIFSIVHSPQWQVKAMINRFCKATQEYDFEVIRSSLPSTSEDESARSVLPESGLSNIVLECLGTLANDIEYKITNVLIDQDHAIVEVKFTYPDAQPVVLSAIGEFIPQMLFMNYDPDDNDLWDAMFVNILQPKLDSTKLRSSEAVVYFNCTKRDGEWKINKLTPEIIAVLTFNTSKLEDHISEEETTETVPEKDEVIWHDVTMGKEITLATLKVTVTGSRETSSFLLDNLTDKAQPNSKYVVFDLKLENITKEPFVFYMENYPFYDSEGRNYELYFGNKFDLIDIASGIPLAPNIPVSAIAVYNVPSTSTGHYFSIRKQGTDDGYRFYGDSNPQTIPEVDFGYVFDEPPTETTANDSASITSVYFEGYVIFGCGGLNVRSGPGIQYDKVGRLDEGSEVVITEIQQTGNSYWGNIGYGWVSMDYISEGTPPLASLAVPPQSIIDQYVGHWGDIISQRCMMQIDYQHSNFIIEISWGNSASSTDIWQFTGSYDAYTKAVGYSNGRHLTREYLDSGEIVETVHTSNGTGYFFIGYDGYLYWEDRTENCGVNCAFEKFQ